MSQYNYDVNLLKLTEDAVIVNESTSFPNPSFTSLPETCSKYWNEDDIGKFVRFLPILFYV